MVAHALPTASAASASPKASHVAGKAIRVSTLLATLAHILVCVILGDIQVAYWRIVGRDDLEIADSFIILANLRVRLIYIEAAGGLCLFVSAVLCLTWFRRATWSTLIWFVVQWLIAAVVLTAAWVMLVPKLEEVLDGMR